MKKIFFGVDGTGPKNDLTYEAQFRDSFVSVLMRKDTWTHAGYRRGPDLFGGDTLPSGQVAAEIVSRWISANGSLASENRSQPLPFLCLAGYSRGGAAVIHACKVLKRRNIAVDCLLLYDAVDWVAFSGNLDIIPNNVRFAFHARRDRGTLSRTTFGWCGTKIEPADGQFAFTPVYSEKFFHGSHGAIGGVPWVRSAPTAAERSDAIQSISSKIVDPVTFAIRAYGVVRNTIDRANMVLKTEEEHMISEHPLFSTKVSYAKDQEVVKAVSHWMQSNLLSAKLAHALRQGPVELPKGPYRAYA